MLVVSDWSWIVHSQPVVLSGVRVSSWLFGSVVGFSVRCSGRSLRGRSNVLANFARGTWFGSARSNMWGSRAAAVVISPAMGSVKARKKRVGEFQLRE